MVRRPFFAPKPRRAEPNRKKKAHLLEKTSTQEIRRIKLLGRAYLRLQWDFYSELAYQRAEVADRIRETLLEAVEEDFELSKWQRIVKFKYSTRPLSVAGSLKDPGGRFNIGDIDPARFPPFPALYVAKDRPTAIQEIFGDPISKDSHTNLSLALTNPASITAVSISGKLDSVINLKKPQKLDRFVNTIKPFRISSNLQKRAQALRVSLPAVMRNLDELMHGILFPNWRLESASADIPAPSQIFGQLVANAGICGIVYPSKYSGKDCAAIFPQNFPGTTSNIQLDDAAPAEVACKRIDGETWERLENEFCN